jgi:hypothetical protein
LQTVDLEFSVAANKATATVMTLIFSGKFGKMSA